MVPAAPPDALAPPTAPAREPTRARHPDATGFVHRDGARVFWERYGSGQPAVLLMPTWSIAHSRHWKLQIPTLARHHTVVTFDGPGNGRSDRPTDPARYADAAFATDATAVMDAAGVSTAAVAGLSMGAGYSLRLAADHPDRVLGLVMIGPSIPLDGGGLADDDPFWAPPTADEGWATYNAAFWRRDWPGFVAFFMRQVVHEPHSTKAIEDLVGWALETDPETMVTIERAGYLRDPVATSLIGRVRCPSLVISGTEDRVEGHGHAREIAELLGARFERLVGSGHAPNVRDPVRVNLAIRAFVATLPGGAR